MTDRKQSTQYVVLIDVVDSRNIDDREAFERRLEGAFEVINEAQAEHLSTPLTRMKGIDEFGCVVTKVAPIPDLIVGILDRIHPVRVRVGIASGAIDVGAGGETVAEMDGPAFHRASALLEEVEASELYVGVDTSSDVDGVLESALNLLLLEREGLTDRQMEVIRAYEEHGTQTSAGEELGLQQQAVSNALRRANYHRRRAIRQTLSQALEKVYD